MHRLLLRLKSPLTNAGCLALVAILPLRPGQNTPNTLPANASTTSITRAAKVAPTQSLGAFIVPVRATASSSQSDAGRTADKLIDGSGLEETAPGSSVFVHTANVFADGNCMWNGATDATLDFDLGRVCGVRGVYVWNYNEGSGYNNRSVREVTISASEDGRTYTLVGNFTFDKAPGTNDYAAQAVPFAAPVRARYFRWKIVSNYGGDMAGLSEVRFADADHRAALPTPPAPWKPTYPRPTYPDAQHKRRPQGGENIVYPADSGVVDVTLPPYNAHGDGKMDDTAALQKALDDNTDRGAILYLPNGVYRISRMLTWGGDEGRQRNTVLQGQSRDGTVLQLQDACPGFQNPRRPQGCIYTGHAPAQRFGNEIHNLTLDTGMGNPGACGIQFIANNQGGVYDVAIVSGDGQGVIGLDLGYTDEQGPCLMKNVRVVGFDLGIHTATSVASETLEHIRLEHQNRYGMRNDGQPCTIRDLQSTNAVPALYNGGGFCTLVDSVFTGTGKASGQPALVNRAALFARNVRTTGYRSALESVEGGATHTLPGPLVARFLSDKPVQLFGDATGQSLNLPVRETPELPWDTPASWIAPQKFGAKADNEMDASPAIQQAIDAGATTVYLPRGAYRIGHTILLRGRVRRLIGCKAFLIPIAPLNGQNAPLFRLTDGVAPTVAVEGINTDFSGGPYFFLEHDSPRTLVMRRLAINFQAAEAYRTGPHGTGDVFWEDVVGRYFHLRGQKLWARQFNPEVDGVHLENDGGTAWILGLKTEGGGPLLDLKNGSRTELLGSFSYTVGDSRRAPMVVIDNAQASLTFAEVCYTGAPFPILVRETQHGTTLELKHDDPRWPGHFTLYTTGRSRPVAGNVAGPSGRKL